jgi:hypothetical protein
MALTLQQQIAQQEQARAEREQAIMNFRKQSRADRRALREDLRARGEPKGFHPEILALREQQRADPLGFALGKTSVAAVGMGTRDLRRGIESLQRQVSQPFSQLSNLVKGGSDQLVQKGLSGQADLGDVAVSVSGRQPMTLQNAASKYGMSVPQFLQMNPQYAGRSQLSPGEIYKVAGQASSLPDQLEAQQMRYDANVSPELAQLLQDPAQSGILNAYNNLSNLRKRSARFSNQATNLAEREGITQAAAKQQLRNEGGGLSKEQRERLQASKQQLRNEGAILNPLFRSLGTSFDQSLRQNITPGGIAQMAESLQPLSLEESQAAYAEQVPQAPQAPQANPYGGFSSLYGGFSNPYGGFSNPYGGFSNPYGGFSQAGPTMLPMDYPQAGSMVPNRRPPTGMPREGVSNPAYSGIGSFVTQGIGLGSQNLYNAPMASVLSSQPSTGAPLTGGVF